MANVQTQEWVDEYLSYSGMSEELLIQKDRGIIETWKGQIDSFLDKHKDLVFTPKIVLVNGKEKIVPYHVVEIASQDVGYNMSRVMTWDEYMNTIPEQFRDSVILNIAITRAQYNARWFAWRLLFCNRIQLLKDQRPITEAECGRHVDDIVKLNIYHTHEPGWLITNNFSMVDYISLLMFPGTEMKDLNKLLGGRVTLEQQFVIRKSGPLNWNYVESDANHSTIYIGSKMPYIDSDGQIQESESGKLVSSRLKAMYCYRPDKAKPGEMIVPKEAIKGLNYHLGWHLTEVHEVTAYQNDRMSISLNTYILMYQILFDTPSIMKRLGSKIKLIKSVLMSEASIADVIELLNFTEKDVELVKRGRVMQMLELAFEANDKRILQTPEVREYIMKQINSWLIRMELKVPTIQGKIFCDSTLMPGGLYVNQAYYDLMVYQGMIDRKGFAYVVRNPYRVVMKLPVVPMQHAYTMAVGFWGHPDTFKPIDGDDDGDLLNTIKPSMVYQFALPYQLAVKAKDYGIKQFKDYIDQNGSFIEDPVESLNPYQMEKFVRTAFSASIGVNDQRLRYWTFQAIYENPEAIRQDFYGYQRIWSSLFEFKNHCIDSKKAAHKLFQTIDHNGVEQIRPLMYGDFLQFAMMIQTAFMPVKIMADKWYPGNYYQVLAPQGPIREVIKPLIDPLSNSLIGVYTPIEYKDIANTWVTRYSNLPGSINKDIYSFKRERMLNDDFIATVGYLLVYLKFIPEDSWIEMAQHIVKDGFNRYSRNYTMRASVFVRLKKAGITPTQLENARTKLNQVGWKEQNLISVIKEIGRVR